jgi:UDP-N-acetylmuramate dehydrogenase
VHHQQALVIINPLGAPGAAVLNFANAVQADIKRKFGVLLEIEPQIV